MRRPISYKKVSKIMMAEYEAKMREREKWLQEQRDEMEKRTALIIKKEAEEHARQNEANPMIFRYFRNSPGMRYQNVAREILEWIENSNIEIDISKSLDDYLAKNLEDLANGYLLHLKFLAENGHPEAIVILAKLSRNMVQFVSSLPEKHQESLKTFARTVPSCPLLVAPKSIYPQKFKPTLEQLEVGLEPPDLEEEMRCRSKHQSKKLSNLVLEKIKLLNHFRTKESAAIYWNRPTFPRNDVEVAAADLPPFGPDTSKEWETKVWGGNHGRTWWPSGRK